MAGQFDSVSELAASVATDEELKQRIQQDPVAALNQLAAPLQSDVWIYRIVVGCLGLLALLAVVGAIVIVLASDKTIPDVVVALGSASVGALAGLLAPSPGR